MLLYFVFSFVFLTLPTLRTVHALAFPPTSFVSKVFVSYATNGIDTTGYSVYGYNVTQQNFTEVLVSGTAGNSCHRVNISCASCSATIVGWTNCIAGPYWCSDGTIVTSNGFCNGVTTQAATTNDFYFDYPNIPGRSLPLVFVHDPNNQETLWYIQNSTNITVHLFGAGGGGSPNTFTGGNGGAGAYVTGILHVPANVTLRIIVGAGGASNHPSPQTELQGGGGAGGLRSGQGGGRSAIQRLINGVWEDLVTAGGGGGGSGACGSNGGTATWLGPSGNGTAPGKFRSECWMFNPSIIGGMGANGVWSGGLSGYPTTLTGLGGYVDSVGFNYTNAVGTKYKGGNADALSVAGGGGGGYYGGSASPNAGGGAGSSFIANLLQPNGTNSTDLTVPLVDLSAQVPGIHYIMNYIGYGGGINRNGGNGLVILDYPRPSATPLPGSTGLNMGCTMTIPQMPSCSPSPSLSPSTTSTFTNTQSNTPSVTSTVSPSPTGTGTPSPTMSVTPTGTGTGTSSPTGSVTPTPTPSTTSTFSIGATPSSTNTGTSSSSATGTATSTATATSSSTATRSATRSAVPTSSSTSTKSSVPTESSTASSTGTSTSTSSATATATSSATSTSTGTGTSTLTSTPTSSITPSPSGTPTPSTSVLPPSATSTPTPTISDSSSNTPTPSQTPSNSPTSSVTPSISMSSTNTATGTATGSGTATSSATESSTATLSSSSTASATASSSASSSATSSSSASSTTSASASASSSASSTATTTATPTPTSSQTPSGTGTSTPTPSSTGSDFPIRPILAIGFEVYQVSSVTSFYIPSTRETIRRAIALTLGASNPDNVTLLVVKDASSPHNQPVIYVASRSLQNAAVAIRVAVTDDDAGVRAAALLRNVTELENVITQSLRLLGPEVFGSCSVTVKDLLVPPVVPRYPPTQVITSDTFLGLAMYIWIIIGAGAGVLMIIGAIIMCVCIRRKAFLAAQAAAAAAAAAKEKANQSPARGKFRRMNSLLRGLPLEGAKFNIENTSTGKPTDGDDEEETAGKQRKSRINLASDGETEGADGDTRTDPVLVDNPLRKSTRPQFSVDHNSLEEPKLPMDPPRPIERITFDFPVSATTNPYHLMFLGDPDAKTAILSAIHRAEALTNKLNETIAKIVEDVNHRRDNLEKSGVPKSVPLLRLMDAVDKIEETMPSHGMRQAEVAAIRGAEEDKTLLELRRSKYVELASDLRRLLNLLEKNKSIVASREARTGKKAQFGVSSFAPTTSVALDNEAAIAKAIKDHEDGQLQTVIPLRIPVVPFFSVEPKETKKSIAALTKDTDDSTDTIGIAIPMDNPMMAKTNPMMNNTNGNGSVPPLTSSTTTNRPDLSAYKTGTATNATPMKVTGRGAVGRGKR